jgi:hypothetical protein
MNRIVRSPIRAASLTALVVAAGLSYAQTPGQMEYERQQREYWRQQEQQRQEQQPATADAGQRPPPAEESSRITPSLPPGRYWVLSDARVANKHGMWNQPVDVKGGDKTLTLDARNAMPVD